MVYGRTMQTRVNHKKKHTIAPPENWRISIGYHEPQMSAEEWLALQGFFGRHVFVKELKHETTLLKGILRCKKCGRLLGLSRKKKVDGSVSTWYKCYNRERRGVCDMSQIKAELLDEKVLEIFRSIEHDPATIEKYVKVEKKAAGSGDQLRKNIKKTEEKIDRLTGTLATSAQSSAAKYIVAEIEKLDVELQKLKREEAKLSQEKRRNAAALKNAENKRTEIEALLANFDNFTMEEKNEIAKRVIREAAWDGETLFIML